MPRCGHQVLRSNPASILICDNNSFFIKCKRSPTAGEGRAENAACSVLEPQPEKGLRSPVGTIERTNGRSTAMPEKFLEKVFSPTLGLSQLRQVPPIGVAENFGQHLQFAGITD